jgi:hypothetical protein
LRKVVQGEIEVGKREVGWKRVNKKPGSGEGFNYPEPGRT